MTGGGEIVPMAASAAGKAAKVVLGEDETVKQQLARMAEDTPPMRHAAEQYAQRVAIKQEILTKMYRQIVKLFRLREDYFREDFATDMAERLDGIPEENLTEPRANIAVPAMEALGYSLDEPDLKEMYLSLLATATDSSRADQAHPSFVEVIRQLSGQEAPLLNEILARHNQLPIARIRINVPTGGYRVAATHVTDTRDKTTGEPVEEKSSPVWINNWIRLGLIDVDYSQHLAADGAYDWVENRPEFESARATAAQLNQSVNLLSDASEFSAGYQQGLLTVTDFGRRFAYAIGARTVTATE